MNDQLFGLPLAPFSAVPDVNLFVETPGACEAIHQLTRSLLRDDGIVVLTGDVGVGKTMIGKILAERLSHKVRPLVLSSSNFPTRRALYQSVLFSLGRDFVGLSEQEARLLVLESSREHLANRGNLVLIIDEAHLLTDRLLDELRSLISNVDEGRLLMQVVLIGHFSLQERLKDPRFLDLQHRIGCITQVQPMSQAETTDYISRRLGLAGRDVFDVFAPGALQLIVAASGGYPRCVNTLCDRAIGLAVESSSPIIDEILVRSALAELRQLPMAWIETGERQPGVPELTGGNIPALEDHSGIPLSESHSGLCQSHLVGASIPIAETAPLIAIDLSEDEDWASFEIGAEWPEDIKVADSSGEAPLRAASVTEFEEIPVFDPYAQFDAEYGEMLRHFTPPAIPPATPARTETQRQPAIASERQASEPSGHRPTYERDSDAHDPRWIEEFVEESWPEISVLEAIHELRAGIAGRVSIDEHDAMDGDAVDTSPDVPSVEFDVVEPEWPSLEASSGAGSRADDSVDMGAASQLDLQSASGTIEQPSERVMPVDSPSRFAGLFTRLRQKRRALADDAHTGR